MDLGTPIFDEQLSSLKASSASKKTTTAAADTSTEVAKKCKDQFRVRMSQHIVNCLNPFRKPDCKLGRIKSTEEFKHLARKVRCSRIVGITGLDANSEPLALSQ